VIPLCIGALVLKREIAKSFSKHRIYGLTIPPILKYLIKAQTIKISLHLPDISIIYKT